MPLSNHALSLASPQHSGCASSTQNVSGDRKSARPRSTPMPARGEQQSVCLRDGGSCDRYGSSDSFRRALDLIGCRALTSSQPRTWKILQACGRSCGHGWCGSALQWQRCSKVPPYVRRVLLRRAVPPVCVGALPGVPRSRPTSDVCTHHSTGWRRRWAGRELETAGGTDGGGQADRKRR
jgi:hypothetical protein